MKHLSSFILQNIASFTIGQVLGERLKYSCCLWSEGATTLEEGVKDLIRLMRNNDRYVLHVGVI